MKTLRTLTIVVTSFLTVVCVWTLSPPAHTWAQDETQKQKAGEDSDAGQQSVSANGDNAKSKNGADGKIAAADQAKQPVQEQSNEPLRSKPVVLRRNEASGAAALITMEEARDKLIGYKSVQAEVAETVTLGTRKLRVKGKYLQGTDLQLRFEYEINVGGTKGKLLEVCDGQILWTYYEVGKQKRVARRSVRQILEGAGSGPENLLIAEIGLGGLPGLLASIQKAFVFDKQWEQDVDKNTFVVVEGSWSPRYRAKFLGPQPSDDDPLPMHVPERVRIYFDSKFKFPRRIMYLKEDPTTRVKHPMVKLDFVNVEWDVQLDEEAFSYTPPENVPREDTTEHYVKQFAAEDDDQAQPKTQQTQ